MRDIAGCRKRVRRRESGALPNRSRPCETAPWGCTAVTGWALGHGWTGRRSVFEPCAGNIVASIRKIITYLHLPIHHPIVSCFADLLLLLASNCLYQVADFLIDSIHIPQFVHASFLVYCFCTLAITRSRSPYNALHSPSNRTERPHLSSSSSSPPVEPSHWEYKEQSKADKR